MTSIEINRRTYGYLNPYVIAEIGVNHEGNLARAKAMIEMVARGGGHAAKFQTYKADKLAVPDHSPAYWNLNAESATSQHALFKKYDSFGPVEYGELAEHCLRFGIDFLSTPFDLEAVDYLAPLVPAFKIASADITNIPLLRRVAFQSKPVILSTGASTFSEIEQAIGVLEQSGARSISLLHCVLRYPTEKRLANLSRIAQLQSSFGASGYPIGYSDHVVPDPDGSMPALEVAVVQGSVILEKHFTDDKTGRGNDHYHAMNEQDLSRFVQTVTDYRELYGDGKQTLEVERLAIENARRRIVAVRDLSPGHVLGDGDLVALRGNAGIGAEHWDKVVGMTIASKIAAGQIVEWKNLS